MQCTLIPEPNLYFGNQETCIDPKVGLINFGPFGRFSEGKDQPLVIRAGVISTKSAKAYLDSWLERLRYPIRIKAEEKSSKHQIDFPGISLKSPLKFEIRVDKSCVEYLQASDINSLENYPSKKERILKAIELYEQKFSDLADTADPPPDIVFIPLPPKLIKLCGDENGKIIYERKTFDERKLYTNIPMFDFHNVLKVIAFKNRMVSQVLRPSTLEFSGSQDPATIAWNFAVATYYKATGIPWKLADMDDETCYVGISFFQEITSDGRYMRASMAHVYLRTGESQVIRGRPFKHDETQSKKPSLPSNLAFEIVNDVINLYKRQRGGVSPKRIVIHKTSPFTLEEIEGFNKATTDIEIVDYVHIYKKSGILLFSRDTDYPPIRGTIVYKNKQMLLYTTGYVASLNTYVGSSIPQPLFMNIYRLESPPTQIAKDIMALTKLDWNNADFNTRLPVTISVSRKVGEILSESSARGAKAPSSYRYYM